MTVTVIGRGHGGTRSMSHTLTASGVFMGEPLNKSGDLLPPEAMYKAATLFGQRVKYLGNMEWDFSAVLNEDPTAEFRALIEEYLQSVLGSKCENKGWKIPETTLCYPWIVKMFPDIKYIHWVRDPRDSILSSHKTDDLADFGVEYDHTDNIRLRRAISWEYQRKLMRATPTPANLIKVRFEDMVLKQDETLSRLSEFLGIELAKIEMRPDSVGRYKTDEDEHYFDFFRQDMEECGYEL